MILSYIPQILICSVLLIVQNKIFSISIVISSFTQMLLRSTFSNFQTYRDCLSFLLMISSLKHCGQRTYSIVFQFFEICGDLLHGPTHLFVNIQCVLEKNEFYYSWFWCSIHVHKVNFLIVWVKSSISLLIFFGGGVPSCSISD